MNDSIFSSMSAYKMVSDIIAQTDRILERNNSISDAVAKSTSIIRGFNSSTKYASTVIPMLNNSAWLKNDVIGMYSNATSASMSYSMVMDYPKLPTIPQWILDLKTITDSSLQDVFIAQKSWQIMVPAIPEISVIKNAMGLVSMFKDVNEASKNIAEVMKISESITKFDASVNHLYKFINGFDDHNNFQMDIQSQLTAAFTIDLEGAATEDKKIIMTRVFQSLLDSLSTMSIDFTLEKEQRLFLNKLKSLYDEWNKNGVIFNSIMIFWCIFQPVIQHYHNEIFDLEDDKRVVIINQSKVENDYINESSIQVVTTAIKFLKENPDNRLKVKFTIPVGTKITVVQDKGKWIKVKFTCDGVFYRGWTFNSYIK